MYAPQDRDVLSYSVISPIETPIYDTACVALITTQHSPNPPNTSLRGLAKCDTLYHPVTKARV